MSSIYIGCYPKVGSQYLKGALSSTKVPWDGRPAHTPTVIKTHHHMNLKWLQDEPNFNKDSKIIYLCANPMNAVLSLITNKHLYKSFCVYSPTLKCKKLSLDTLISYDNIFACTPAEWTPGGWVGSHTLISNLEHRMEILTEAQIEDISINFVSYVVNSDLLGYQEHFDTWTKTPMEYERCILRYEYLNDSDILRSLEEFLEVEPFSLERLATGYKQRKNIFVPSTDPFETALEKTYGPLAAEINKLDGFTRLPRE